MPVITQTAHHDGAVELGFYSVSDLPIGTMTMPDRGHVADLILPLMDSGNWIVEPEKDCPVTVRLAAMNPFVKARILSGAEPWATVTLGSYADCGRCSSLLNRVRETRR